MDTDLIVGSLKAASAAITGVLGIAAILTNYKKPNGELTRGGRWVFAGIAVSTFVGLLTTGFETYKAREDSKEQAKRTETVLREVTRAVQPITQMGLYAALEVPPGNKKVDPYIARFRAGIAEIGPLFQLPMSEQFTPDNLAKRGGIYPSLNDDGSVATYAVQQNTKYWPTREQEMDLHLLVTGLDMPFYIFKKPIEPKDFEFVGGLADFEAYGSSSVNRMVMWHVKSDRLRVSLGSTTLKRAWKTNGKITSVIDLYGAQLVLVVPGSFPGKIGNEVAPWAKEAQELAKSLILRTASLDLGEGRVVSLPPDKFTKSPYKGGEPLLTYTFPETEEEFAKLYQYRKDDY